jgi:hypothetical protein
LPSLTLPTLTLPPVTLPPLTLPALLPTTTTTPTTTTAPTTTTVPPRPDWLPPADVATTLYFDVPGPVDVAARPLLPLVRNAPLALAATDADGDGRSGITLARTPPGQPTPPTGELAWALDAPTDAHIQGPASGTVYATTSSLLASTVAIRARLMVCDADGNCSVVSERTGSGLVTVVALLPIVYNFGTIDVIVPAGGTLRVVLDVPSSSSGDALLAADATLSASAITVVFR